jgi:Tfp pilus assembly protein PilF
VLRAVAQFYVRHGEASSALSLYTTAAEADPDDPVIAREMAALLERLGRVTAALDVSRDAGRRALERLAGSRTGEWAAAASGRDEDRRLLLLAAGLEERAGDRARAAEYLAALSR